jgi:hypothetical protein
MGPLLQYLLVISDLTLSMWFASDKHLLALIRREGSIARSIHRFARNILGRRRARRL